MAIDFPASPSNGQIYSPGTPPLSWTYDGTKWVASSAGATAYVAKTGDTMSGALTLPGAPTVPLHAATKAYVDAAAPVPLTIAKGGTNAITAPAALTSLGAVARAGDTMSGALVVDTNAGALQAAAAGTLLHLGAADATATRLTMDGYGVNPAVSFRRSNGTAALPTALAVDDALTTIQFWGYGTSSYQMRCSITAFAAQAWTDAAQGTYLQFTTTANGTTANTERMRIDHNGNVGIGLTPTAKLHVAATTTSTPSVLVGNSFGGHNIAKVALHQTTNNTDTLVMTRATNTAPTGFFMRFLNADASANMFIVDVAGNATFSGAVTTGTLAVNGGATNDPLAITVNSGGYARQTYTVSGTRTWKVGLPPSGEFFISDETVPAVRISIDLSGNCKNLTGTWAAISSAELKQDIEPYARGLAAVEQLTPVQFRYRPGTPFTTDTEPSPLRFGLLAEDVRPVMPEVVIDTTANVRGKEQAVEAINSGDLLYALINAVKELSAKVQLLEGKLQ